MIGRPVASSTRGDALDGPGPIRSFSGTLIGFLSCGGGAKGTAAVSWWCTVPFPFACPFFPGVTCGPFPFVEPLTLCMAIKVAVTKRSRSRIWNGGLKQRCCLILAVIVSFWLTVDSRLDVEVKLLEVFISSRPAGAGVDEVLLILLVIFHWPLLTIGSYPPDPDPGLG